MAIKFDFDTTPVTFTANVPVSSSSLSLKTIPITTAAFPLSANRVLVAHMEAVGVDGNGVGVFWSDSCLIQGGSPATQVTMHDAFPHATADGASTYDLQLYIDGSGDLEIVAGNTSATVAFDIAVRVTLRLVGTA